MAINYINWKDLYFEAEKNISFSADNWKSFLNMCSKIYDVDFYAQIAIYAQRQDVECVNTYMEWKKHGFQVKSGSKSFSVFFNGVALRLFDIKDTIPQKGYLCPENIWNIDLSSTNKIYFVKIVNESINNLLANNKDDYKELIVNSAKYIILHRLSDIVDLNIDNNIFQNLPQSANDLHRIGATINFVAKNVLEKIKKLEISNDISYDIIRDILSKNKEVEKNDKFTNARNILPSRGEFSSTQHQYSTANSSRNSEQVWFNETEVLRGTEARYVSSAVQNGRDRKTSYRSTTESRGEVRTIDRGDGNSRGNNRTTEKNKSVEMGTVNEQLSSESRRNSDEPGNIRVNYKKSRDENSTFFYKDDLKHSRNNRTYMKFTSEDMQIVRNTNLVDYLSSRGEKLIRVGTKEYTLSNHDSMRINNNQWYWNSQNMGGNALDFLMKYYNFDFHSAVIELLRYNGYSISENSYSRPQFVQPAPVERPKQEVRPLPTYPFELDTKTNRVYAYLTKTRNISPDIVKYVIDKGLVVQDIKGNAVFNIYDENGNLSGAEIVGTYKPENGRSYRHISEQNGNGFRFYTGSSIPKKAIFFEAAIDLLSYYNLHRDEDALLVSMTGLKDKIVLKTMQDYNLSAEQCYISSDNDEAGKNFAEKCAEKYGTNTYRVNNEPIFSNYPDIKDWNDLLSAVKQFDALMEDVKTNQPLSKNISNHSPNKHKITEADIVDALQFGTNQPNGKTDIASLYNGIKFTKERVLAIEEKYGIGTSPITFTDGNNGYIEYTSIGLIIRKGEYLAENAVELHLPWSDVEKRIRALIDNNNYLINDEEVIITEPPKASVEVSISDKPLDIEPNKNEDSEDKKTDNENNLPELSDYVLNNMPDDTVTIAERNEFGYTDNHLLPILREKALELFSDNKLSVFLLYPDNTKGQVYSKEDIINHNGMYGIETEEWESYIAPPLETARKTAEEQGLAFSTKFSNGADDDFNPYVYDGTMNLEDFNKVQNAYSQEAEVPLSEHIQYGINTLISNYNFNSNVQTLLTDVKDYMIENNVSEFTLNILSLPTFFQKYGSRVKINKDYFDGKLKEIAAELNLYIKQNMIGQEKSEVSVSTSNNLFEPLRKAINHIKETHSFSDKTEKLLDNAFKLSSTNNKTTFDLSIFEDIAMKDKYGPLTRINEKYFDGTLYSIANEINNYINDYNRDKEIISDNEEVVDFATSQFLPFGRMTGINASEIKQNLEKFSNEDSVASTEITSDEVEIDTKSNNEPYVYVEWSEHSEIKSDTEYTLSEFNSLIAKLDAAMIEGRTSAIDFYGSEEKWYDADYKTDEYKQFRGYYKTSFEIRNLPPDGSSYTGRYDIGDGDGTLINHIRLLTEYDLEHYADMITSPDEKEEFIESKKYILNTLIPFLETSIELQSNEAAIESVQMSTPIRQASNAEVPFALDNHSTIHFLNKPVEESIITDARKSIVTNESIVYQSETGYVLYGDVKKNNEFIEEAVLRNFGEDKEAIIQYINDNNYKVSTIENPLQLIKSENYHINDNEFIIGTPKVNFRRNIDAIKLLNSIEADNRQASPNEQKILAQYVGWGGLQDAFDSRKSNWINEYNELRTLLTESEYIEARASVLNAHYTSPVIIDNIYKVLNEVYGFTGGTILEPSMGVGNFFGRLPDSMSSSKLYGVEIDNLTGRIAKQLYPNANIQIKGFEETTFTSNTFDVAIGNVPFGEYMIHDKEFKKDSFIHDYFFKKSLDKVHPGGIIAFITSKGTMDKQDSSIREYLAERADLLGAIRLPNTAFKNANTKVTSDIIFLQKREALRDLDVDHPEWIDLAIYKDNIQINKYFVNHPQMILGNIEAVSGRFGQEITCQPFDNISLEESLSSTIATLKEYLPDNYKTPFNYHKGNEAINVQFQENNIDDTTIEKYTYGIVDDKVYYNTDKGLQLCKSKTASNRIKGLLGIKSAIRDLIQTQLNSDSDFDIKEKQNILNTLYDDFTEKYGLINSKANKRAFKNDNNYYLLSSLENIDDKGNLISKADIFSKRTIKKSEVITSVDSSSEALIVSLNEKGAIDLDYMSSLVNKPIDNVILDLQGIIYKNPLYNKEDKYFGWETASEYLSGNIKEKLELAKVAASTNPLFQLNVNALQEVIPKPIKASDISVRLGATWIPINYINDFLKEVLNAPSWINVVYSRFSNEYRVNQKNNDYGNSTVLNVYGTDRINGYYLFEKALNLKDVRIYDEVIEGDKVKRVINNKETVLAQQKQDLLKESFKNWIFKDPERRNDLCNIYNYLFNSTRPREYNGSHLVFPEMNVNITLKEHQKNAVARGLYGNNTLLAHQVGAGKTFEMIAIAQESKRLGLCNKSLFVVPNHLIDQWSSEYLRLYPNANILAVHRTDFTPENRKRFCSKIAVGNYDAVIIGQSQFGMIPLSIERQKAFIENEISGIMEGLSNLDSKEDSFTIKQMEKKKKSLEIKLKKLNDNSAKDKNVVTFEELGVDRLFVDESHYFKNLYLYTKMKNVAGINSSDAEKSSDLLAKCRYIDEITEGKGIVFATGTPISNTMSEMYVNMYYLQYDTLKNMGLGVFDAWASTFGETVTSVELSPEGTGFRSKTRFAKFYNLPELTSLFKEVADIQTADMLKLPVPDVEYHTIVNKPTEFQQNYVKILGDRAEAIRTGQVDRSVDNMLKITIEGRSLALTPKLIDEFAVEGSESKISQLVANAYDIYCNTSDNKSTQLIFCDESTPDPNKYNVYDDIKQRLIDAGVPADEIAFIHSAKTEQQKESLFSAVRTGKVRFLMGSTQKMGAGTNVQDRLIALHHLDIPWKPSDIEQREGRIIRQGNPNKKVHIFKYITENTFDSYSWQLIEKKLRFIGQIMTSKSPARAADDIDDATLSAAEAKALATGNPLIREKMDLDIQLQKLQLMKSDYQTQIYDLQDRISKFYPSEIAKLKETSGNLTEDLKVFKNNYDKESFKMVINNSVYTDKKESGLVILQNCRMLKSYNVPHHIGEICGFKLSIYKQAVTSADEEFVAVLSNCSNYHTKLGKDSVGNISRIINRLNKIEDNLSDNREKLSLTLKQLADAKENINMPFAREKEMESIIKRLVEVNMLLDNSNKQNNLQTSKKQEVSL